MIYKNFDQLIKKIQENKIKKKVAVVVAQEAHTLEAVFKAKSDGLIEPILLGDENKIKDILKSLNLEYSDVDIINSEEDKKTAELAIKLVKDKEADFIMKGKIQTADLLRAVVDKEKGLRTGKTMSLIALHEIPNYHKLLAVTDGGMVMYPDLEGKKNILMNAVETFNKIGYECPKVGVLSAVEKVNPKMPETLDADALKKMNQDGEIKNCIVEGPISYDLAMHKESAEIKGYESEVAGDVDILLVPDICAGNILGKALVYSAQAKMAGFVVGAKVPIVLTSRGSSSQEKYLSIAICAAMNSSN